MMALEEEIFKSVDRIRFSLLSPTELRKLSVVEIQTADTYDEDGVSITSGLMDGRLGTLEPRQKCRTCGNTAATCPGHFGHIELAEPVIHVSFVKLVYKLLTVSCRNCGRILITQEKMDTFRQLIKDTEEKLNTVTEDVYKKILKSAKIGDCPYCGAKNYKIELAKPTSFYEDIDEGAIKLTPSSARERLERIPDEDWELLGMNTKSARPEWMVLQVLPVPPVSVRPSITLESGIRSEDDLTHKLVDIVRINQKLREAMESGVPINIIQELHDLLQYHVTTYFDNEVSGIPPARHRSGRPLKTICQRLRGKEGRFRGNLSGKRVDFSARTVISPDINLDLNEVGVPVDIAAKLTMPERVTKWNMDEMKQLVENGPNKYPGALYIVRPDGRRIRLEFVTERTELVDSIQPGFIIERHLRDGDTVLFNRQPSLHRMSIMAHVVKVLPYKTFRLNPCVCPPYNADFDGDEMNLHVPQNEEAKTEAKLLMQVQDQILSPRYGGPIIGAIRDLLSSAYLLTNKSTMLTKEQVSRLLTASGYEGELPEPDIKKRTPLWTGKSIFSLFIPKGMNFTSKSNACTMHRCKQCSKEKCPHDAYVVIKDGILKQGVIDKNSIGAEKSESLFHRIVKDCGPEEAKKFLNSITKLLDRYITLRGFTYAIDELEISDELREKIRKAMIRAEEKVNAHIEKFRNGALERLPGQTLEGSLEIYVMNELSKVRDLAGEYAEGYFDLSNDGIVMTRAGARGSMLNIGQMAACLGQQSIRGKRILRGFQRRALPFFQPDDAGAEARGFVYSSYRDGLSPIEFFFHAIGGREGLVDTAVRTQQSGYMQRRLINALEHLKVEYDGTVRDSTGNIIQFIYGEDGVDAAKSDHGKAVNIDRLIESVRLVYDKGAKASKKYIEQKIDAIGEEISPALKKDLEKILIEQEGSKKFIDEVIKQVLDNYEKSIIEPGEAAGIVAAQSIGEPGTQMTLRTFHFAGVKEQNVTLGLPRLIEIVDARKMPSTPTMIIHLDKKNRNNREKAQELANMIAGTTIEDIAPIEYDITSMKIFAKLNTKLMKIKGISLDDVKKALEYIKHETSVKDYVIEVSPSELEIPKFKKLVQDFKTLHIKGAPDVKRAFVVEEDGEWIIRTEGSGIDYVLGLPGVEISRTMSNNIHEVSSALGIEAARNVIIREAMGVLDEQGLDVDIRHVMLVADMMTSSGEVLQVGRHGISGEKASPLAKAAFEIAIPTMVDAAVKGTHDELKGVAENVIVGKQIPMGTGSIEVFMSIKK